MEDLTRGDGTVGVVRVGVFLGKENGRGASGFDLRGARFKRLRVREDDVGYCVGESLQLLLLEESQNGPVTR